MPFPAQRPPLARDLRLTSMRPQTQHFIRVLLPLRIRQINDLLPDFVPTMVLRVLIQIINGLFEIGPEGRCEKVLDGLVHGDLIAVGVGDFAVEVEVGAPEGEVDDAAGQQDGDAAA